MWRDYLNPQENIYPGLSLGLDSSLYGPSVPDDITGDDAGARQFYGNQKYQTQRINRVSPDDMASYVNSNNARRPSANYNRGKRHIGPHDRDGIQRLISTGTLAKPLNGSDGIDLVFATYWFFPAKTDAILPKDSECIQDKMREANQRFEEGNKYSGMSPEQFEDAVTRECLQEGGSEMPDNNNGPGGGDEQQQEKIYESQSAYNPFDIHMGQMTVYRLHISCTCSTVKSSSNPGSTKFSKQQRCGTILPIEDQPWSAYMGSHADSYFPFKPPVMPKMKSNPKADSISNPS
jgi:hypothetical protein